MADVLAGHATFPFYFRAKNSMNEVRTREREIHGREGGGASVQRWQFWKQRLEEMAKDEGVGEEIREVARETLREMRRVDGSE